MWQEYDRALTDEDLEAARREGIDLPVLLRLSPNSPVAQAMFQDLHGVPMRPQGVTPYDEAVTEILDVPLAVSLIQKHLGTRGSDLIESLETLRLNDGQRWFVINVLGDDTTHEVHVRRQERTDEPPPPTTLNGTEDEAYEMPEEPYAIMACLIARLNVWGRVRLDASNPVIVTACTREMQQTALAHLEPLVEHPAEVVAAIALLHNKNPEGERVVREALEQRPEFGELFERVEYVMHLDDV